MPPKGDINLFGGFYLIAIRIDRAKSIADKVLQE